MWMGDMLSGMQEEFLSYYRKHRRIIPHVDVLFHPHHGRITAQIPKKLIEEMNPQVIVIGNAPAGDLDYLNADITITQNTAGDILFDIYAKDSYKDAILPQKDKQSFSS